MGGFARDVNTQFRLVEKVQVIIGKETLVAEDDEISFVWRKIIKLIPAYKSQCA
jgi:hypothetical protein